MTHEQSVRELWPELDRIQIPSLREATRATSAKAFELSPLAPVDLGPIPFTLLDALAAPALGQNRLQKAKDAVWGLDKAKSISDVVRLFKGGQQPIGAPVWSLRKLQNLRSSLVRDRTGVPIIVLPAAVVRWVRLP